MTSKVLLSNPRASMYPVPVTLVTCTDGDFTNVLTVSWTGIMCSKPPIVYISVRPERYSFHLLEKNKKFCINIPTTDMLEKVDYCGNVSGNIINKCQECGFSLITLAQSYPKAISECKHHLFCDVIDQLDLGTHSAFIAKVIFEYVDEDLICGDHLFDYLKAQPIAYCRKSYFALSEEIGTYGFTNK